MNFARAYNSSNVIISGDMMFLAVVQYIFANHDANIAHQQSTMNEFLSVAASWMERV